jgi:prephenate dehydratase
MYYFRRRLPSAMVLTVLVASIITTHVMSESPSRYFPSRSKGSNSILLPKGALSEIRSVIESTSQPQQSSILSSSSLSAISSSSKTSNGLAPLRGGATQTSAPATSSSAPKPIRVAFQGEAGAYSEKSLRELLGPNVIAVPRPNFESCYRAVASNECDYALMPIENSLGGSIHENYDLMLRYDLTIVAEHDFRVRHCLLTKPGLDVSKIKYAISHSQALSQCDNYLRARGITPKATYDTAGSAKMISKALKGEAFGREMPEGCTPENTAAIASDLAGQTFGLECKEEGIEDDDSNFTRFLLLGRRGVVQHLNKKIPCKTSLVFTLPNTAGALYKSLACFSLRDIDMSKIESRPMSAALLNYLRFKSAVTYSKEATSSQRYGKDLPRFRYLFYLDILSSELDEGVQNALHHLREQSDYCRVLGSYPAKSRLVGPVAEAVEALNLANEGKPSIGDLRLQKLPSDDDEARQLKIGLIGYGSFGNYLSQHLSQHKVRCIDTLDKVRPCRTVVLACNFVIMTKFVFLI